MKIKTVYTCEVCGGRIEYETESGYYLRHDHITSQKETHQEPREEKCPYHFGKQGKCPVCSGNITL